MTTRSAAIERLTRESAASPEAPKRKPTSLALEDIETETLVFQVRAAGLDMGRVEEIANDLSSPSLDERIHVWWSGHRWIVIDGHHRLEAHKLTQERGGKARKVAVEAHTQMPLGEALGAASSLNAREKVTISREEKADAAWRLVCMGEGSIRQQSEWSGVAQSQISNMRATLKSLLEARLRTAVLINCGWDWSRKKDRGESHRDFDADMFEGMAQDMAKKLSKAAGGERMAGNHEVLARALQIISPALPAGLLQTEAFWDALSSEGRDLLAAQDTEQEGALDF